MTIENKFARLTRNTRAARFFIPVGLALIVFGVILFLFKNDDYLETTGKITAVKELPIDTTAEDKHQEYDVDLTYTVDGKEYTGTFSNLSGTYKVGDDIKVYYDGKDPSKITNSKIGIYIPIALVAAGVLAIVFGIAKTVGEFKKSKQLDSIGAFPDKEFENYKTAPGITEYYFRFDGQHTKPGYIIEDANRNVLFEGKMTKQALIGARTYEFRNHQNGKTESHEVGHTMTSTYNNEFFSVRSWFKFDGKNVWDVLHEQGFRMTTDLHSKFPYMVYNVAKNGAAFARVETCGVYVHEDEEAQHKVTVPSGSMYYRFWTGSDDFEALFLNIFAISESEQAVVE